MSGDMSWTRRDPGYTAPKIDTSVAHSARVYDYVLGGKDNYAPDREAAEQMLKNWPSLRTSMRENRRFMHRTVRHLAAERGIRQFLDIGTGIPTSPNLHEIAQEVAPEARVVYVDNDPIVLAHAQHRLNGTPEGGIAYIHANLRDPDAILTAPQLRATLDLDRPVALSVIAVLQFVLDDEEAYGLVERYMAALPTGSFLALSTVTTDSTPKAADVVSEYKARGIPPRERTKAQVERFFHGLELVEPGVQLVHRWRPDVAPEEIVPDTEVAMYGGVALKA
jgi:hypothetical protein